MSSRCPGFSALPGSRRWTWSGPAALTYLRLDLGFGLPPLLLLGLAARREIAQHGLALGLTVAGSLAYSALAERTAQRRRLWRASEGRTRGPRPLGAPWEEWLSLVEMALGLGAVTLLLEERSSRPKSR